METRSSQPQPKKALKVTFRTDVKDQTGEVMLHLQTARRYSAHFEDDALVFAASSTKNIKNIIHVSYGKCAVTNAQRNSVCSRTSRVKVTKKSCLTSPLPLPYFFLMCTIWPSRLP